MVCNQNTLGHDTIEFSHLQQPLKSLHYNLLLELEYLEVLKFVRIVFCSVELTFFVVLGLRDVPQEELLCCACETRSSTGTSYLCPNDVTLVHHSFRLDKHPPSQQLLNQLVVVPFAYVNFQPGFWSCDAHTATIKGVEQPLRL